MHNENYIFIDSKAIRAEYTYYVCFKSLPEHEAYFNRPTFLSAATSYRESVASSSVASKKRGIMAAARESISQYESEMSDRKKKPQQTRGGPKSARKTDKSGTGNWKLNLQSEESKSSVNDFRDS